MTEIECLTQCYEYESIVVTKVLELMTNIMYLFIKVVAFIIRKVILSNQKISSLSLVEYAYKYFLKVEITV